MYNDVDDVSTLKLVHVVFTCNSISFNARREIQRTIPERIRKRVHIDERRKTIYSLGY
jgi:hypothetical protein